MSAHNNSPPLTELTARQLQWITAGFVMMLSTMPGQTVFIAQFNTSLRDTFGLSHGAFGGLYTVATLFSAFFLVFAGVLADRLSSRRLTIATLAGLALAAMVMASAENVALLVVGLACLRFFGQGMLSLVAMTTMSRWFNRFRGRALSFSALGFTTGEALVPFMVTLAIASVGWRQVWFGATLVIVLISSPVIFLLMRNTPDGKRAQASGSINPDANTDIGLTGQKWTRGRVLKDPLFYLVITGIMAPPAIGTLFIFHQAHLVTLKGWDLTIFTAFYPALSAAVVSASLLAGFLVDRFGAWRLMPFLLLPLAAACLVAGTQSSVWSIPLFFALHGAAMGLMAPVVGALWAELYGTAHLGGVRSLATAALVAASAVGPGIAGFLIDKGFDLEAQSFVYAAYCLCGAVLFALGHDKFAKRVSMTRGGKLRESGPLPVAE